MTRRQAPEDDHDVTTRAVIGARLRELRKARGLTLEELGQQVGLTHAFLSQLERGLAAPSVRTLSRLGAALGVGVAALIQQPGPEAPVRITRAGQRPRVINGSRGTLEVLPLSGEGNLFRAALATGEVGAGDVMSHPGDELVHVLSGTVVIRIAGEDHTLGPGDTIVFDGALDHTYETEANEPARVLVVVADLDRPAPKVLESFSRRVDPEAARR